MFGFYNVDENETDVHEERNQAEQPHTNTKIVDNTCEKTLVENDDEMVRIDYHLYMNKDIFPKINKVFVSLSILM